MIVRYWWTEDGEAELCRMQRDTMQSYVCYHCGREFSGESYVLDSMVDADRYRLCKSCFICAVTKAEN